MRAKTHLFRVSAASPGRPRPPTPSIHDATQRQIQKNVDLTNNNKSFSTLMLLNPTMKAIIHM